MTDLRQVFDDLVRFETILWGAIDARLQEECGVGLASLNAMLVIDATPLCRVHDIARAVAITVGGASQAVDRLESAGLCARRANPADRRSSIVELTPEGTELLAHRRPRLRPRARPPAADSAARYRPHASGRCPQHAPPVRGHPGSQPCGWRGLEAKLGAPRRPAPPPAPSGRTDTARSAATSRPSGKPTPPRRRRRTARAREKEKPRPGLGALPAPGRARRPRHRVR